VIRYLNTYANTHYDADLVRIFQDVLEERGSDGV
jgi:hypothetical protein